MKIWYDYHDPKYIYIDGYKQESTAAVGGMVMGSMTLLSGLLVLFFVWLA